VLFALLASIVPPSAASAASNPGVLRGPVAALGWLVGDWDCTVIEAKRDPNAPVRVIRRRLTSSPDGRLLLQVQNGSGLAMRGVIGFDPHKKAWFEMDATRGEGSDRQLVIGPADSLRERSLTLGGFLPAPDGGKYPLRTIYAWKDHGRFTFSAQLYRKDKTWETFQRQECVRASPAGTIPGAP